jgi:hypothetical protein
LDFELELKSIFEDGNGVSPKGVLEDAIKPVREYQFRDTQKCHTHKKEDFKGNKVEAPYIWIIIMSSKADFRYNTLLLQVFATEHSKRRLYPAALM